MSLSYPMPLLLVHDGLPSTLEKRKLALAVPAILSMVLSNGKCQVTLPMPPYVPLQDLGLDFLQSYHPQRDVGSLVLQVPHPTALVQERTGCSHTDSTARTQRKRSACI